MRRAQKPQQCNTFYFLDTNSASPAPLFPKSQAGLLTHATLHGLGKPRMDTARLLFC